MGNTISNWYFRLAMCWLLVGVGLGLSMAASHNHSLFPAHAHMNLLGWVTMGVFAFFYRLWPAAGETKVARLQFWTYVPAHLVQMVSLTILLAGNAAIEPLVAASSVVVAIAVIMFVVNAWRHTGAPGAVKRPVAAAAAG